MNVREQGLGAQGRRTAFPGNLSAPANFAVQWPEPGLEKFLYFRSDFTFYICPLLKLHPGFSMKAPSKLRGDPQKSYRKSWFDTQ